MINNSNDDMMCDDSSEFESWIDEYEREHERLIKLCAQKVIGCFEYIEKQLEDYGPGTAQELFEAFLKSPRFKKRPPRGQGKRDLHSAELAPIVFKWMSDGRKRNTLARMLHDEKPGYYGDTAGAINKHIDRLVKERDAQERMAAAFKASGDKRR